MPSILFFVCLSQIVDVPFALAPYYGLGTYRWSSRIGSCIPFWNGYRDMLPIWIHSILIFTIIVTSSVWTFVFTRGFLKRNLKRHEENLNSQNLDIQKQIYSKRVKNLFGICGAFILSNLLSRLPYSCIGVVRMIAGSYDVIPNKYYASTFVLYLLNVCVNPIIQIYFRKDLFGVARSLLRRVLVVVQCKSSHELGLPEARSRSKSTRSRNLEGVRVVQVTLDFTKTVTIGTDNFVMSTKVIDTS